MLDLFAARAVSGLTLCAHLALVAPALAAPLRAGGGPALARHRLASGALAAATWALLWPGAVALAPGAALVGGAAAALLGGAAWAEATGRPGAAGAAGLAAAAVGALGLGLLGLPDGGGAAAALPRAAHLVGALMLVGALAEGARGAGGDGARRALVVAVVGWLAVFGAGLGAGRAVGHLELPRAAAAVAAWDARGAAAPRMGGIPNIFTQRTRGGLPVKGLSAALFGPASGASTAGLEAHRPEARPLVPLSYAGFHLMLLGGALGLPLTVGAAASPPGRRRRALARAAAGAAGLAMLGGLLVAEAGRAPWLWVGRVRLGDALLPWASGWLLALPLLIGQLVVLRRGLRRWAAGP